MTERKQNESGICIRLTAREAEVFSLIIEGNTSKQIADALVCSKRTIDFHLANIYDKLQVSNRIQAFNCATKLGLIDPKRFKMAV